MAKPNLLPRMRSKTTLKGNVYYYYDTCAKPRKWLALGGNYLDALKKYAEYEKEYNAASLEKSIKKNINRKREVYSIRRITGIKKK